MTSRRSRTGAAQPKLKPKPRRAYGYVRVSTDEQAEEGLSLRVQRDKIRAFAKLHDLHLVEIYADEGVSGRNIERPGIQKLLEKVKGKDDETIIIYKLSRLSRHTRDLLFLIEDAFVRGNTRLMSITEHVDTQSPMGRFFLTIMAALAQMERELIAERTKAALDFKKKRGERLGSTPYGFRLGKDRKLVKVPKELKIVRRILRLRKAGGSYRTIADTLNVERVPTKRGGTWHPSTVRYIATNKRYQGV